jgi:hypothetical protein
MGRPGRGAIAGAALLGLLLAGCGHGGPRARAEAAALRRQAAALRELIAAADRGDAFGSRHVTLGIGEGLVRELLELALPIEAEAPPDLRVRLETAEISFDGGEGHVRLRGRLSRAGEPRTYAELLVHGGLHRFEVGEAADRVTARVALDRVEVRQAQATGLRRELVELVLDRASTSTLEALAAQIPPLAIPVRFERSLAHDAVSAGPFEIAPGSVRLRFSVARVMASSGRLWVLLDVSAPGPRGVGASVTAASR